MVGWNVGLKVSIELGKVSSGGCFGVSRGIEILERVMNEQFKALALQAGLGQERWTTTDEFHTFLNKFAYLVVKECVNTIQHSTDRHRKEYFAHLLKEQFEVE